MARIVILAAGQGKRMNSVLPKVLMPLHNRPLIKYLLDAVVDSKVDPRPLIVVAADNRDIISRELKNYSLEYVVQFKPLGTGHAVSCALPRLSEETDKVIVLYGDHPFLKSESLKKFAALELETLAIIPTILPDFEGWRQNFYHWGRIVKNAKGEAEKIVEFKDADEKTKLIKEVNPGFMCFNRVWLTENIKHLSNDNKQGEYYLTDLVAIARQSGRAVVTVPIEAREAMGINTQEELAIAAGPLT